MSFQDVRDLIIDSHRFSKIKIMQKELKIIENRFRAIKAVLDVGMQHTTFVDKNEAMRVAIELCEKWEKE